MLHTRYKRIVDFKSGFACISTSELITDSYYKKNRVQEYTIIIPLITFLSAFSKPKEFAKELSDRAGGLIEEWKTNNGKAQQVGKRLPVDRHWTLLRHEWEDKNGFAQKSELDFGLNTYHYTSTVQYNPMPHQLKHYDIKASKY